MRYKIKKTKYIVCNSLVFDQHICNRIFALQKFRYIPLYFCVTSRFSAAPLPPSTLATRPATVPLYRHLLTCGTCLHLLDLLCTLTGDSGFVRGRRTGLRRLVAKRHEEVLAELVRQFALQERLHEDLEALEVDLLKVRNSACCCQA